MTKATAVERLQRILLLVPWLLERPGVPVDEVCERFRMTRAELAADLDVLGYTGLPGYGGGDLVEATLAGDAVTVRMAPFFRRPLRLSVREALTLVLAGRAVLASGLLDEPADLERGVRKVGALLLDADPGARRRRAAPRTTAGRAAGSRGFAGAAGDHELPTALPSVAIDLGEEGAEHLLPLRRAVEAREVVRLTYRSASKDQTTVRDVEPWALVADAGAWYLEAWCRLARGPRHFRVDRIRALEPTGDHGVRPRAEAPGRVAYEPAPDDVTVVLDLDPAARWVLDEVVVDDVEERGDVRRLRFRVRELGWAARLLVRLGADARVVEPPELRTLARVRARHLLGRYDR